MSNIELEIEEIGLLVLGLNRAFDRQEWYTVVEYCRAIKRDVEQLTALRSSHPMQPTEAVADLDH